MQTLLTFIDSETGIAEIILNRPTVHNAFDETLISDLIAQFNAYADDPSVKLVILKAEGRNFSAGADIQWMKSVANLDYAANVEDAKQLAQLMITIDQFPKPTIAQVQGGAFGGALGLIACCDIAYATQTATFCLSEVKIGLIPAVISPYVLRAIGERACRRYFLSAERFDAQEAHRLGLIHQVTTPEQLADKVHALAKVILKNSPQAMATAKSLIHHIYTHPINESLTTYTAEQIANIRVSKEGQDGLAAFLNKTQPSWLKAPIISTDPAEDSATKGTMDVQ